ncbi:Cytochrome P450 6d3 [Eumeta japonica]|uniref:unspecific monooxygenase n=1 Tax=Eumeta variegata TaxID=151549 RepID=A0A4C2A0P9_EUMVA|nr:Cytochrome P450 6d3 [Eumeta japonica]
MDEIMTHLSAKRAKRCDSGIFWDFLTKDHAFFELVGELYDKYPGVPVVETVSFLTPALVVRSPENVRQILAGDTTSFNHRGIDVNGDVDPLADNLLLMNGIRWKLTRQKMTPLFTAAKL